MANRGDAFFGISIMMGVLSTIMVFLRLLAQQLTRGKFAFEDGCLLMGWALTQGVVIEACIGYKDGLGQHTSDIVASPDALQRILLFEKVTYALTIFWGQSLLWTKLSLIFFYRRVFAGSRQPKWVVYGTYVVEVYVVLVGIIALFNETIQCIPLSFVWDQGYALVGQTPPTTGTCPVFLARGKAMSALNVLSDFLILIVPMVRIWSVQLPQKKKLGVAAVFALGAMGVVISIIRIPLLADLDGGGDLFYDNAVSVLVTVLETNVALICVCLPCLGPLVRRRRRSSRNATYIPGTESSSKLATSAVTPVSRDDTSWELEHQRPAAVVSYNAERTHWTDGPSTRRLYDGGIVMRSDFDVLPTSPEKSHIQGH